MGKQNLVVAQGGGPTVAVNSSLCGVIEQALHEDAIDEVYGARHGLEGLLRAELVDLQEESRETIQKIRHAPGAALGSSRARLSSDEYHRVLDVCRQYNIRYFLYIGGDGTMAACQRVHRMAADENGGVRVVGIPKTVDNDIRGTHHCPGFGSAARYYAVSVRELGMDVESLPTPVSVFETMGRDTGWLAAAAGLARQNETEAPHLIYIPEKPLLRDRFLQDVQRVYDELGWVVAVVSEGVVDETGSPLSVARTAAKTDDFGRGLPGNVGARLAHLIGEELGLRARSEKPGLCARTSVEHASKTDLREAYTAGRDGVRKIVRGESGVMVALERDDSPKYACTTTTVPLKKVAGKKRCVPARFLNTQGNMVTQDFREYAAPLIGQPLPQFARLAKHPV
jgi:6-phosphofructokinase 1